MLGAFVRKAATRAAADEFCLGDALTPELPKLFKRTFRGVHLLDWLEREELYKAGGEEDFRRAAEAAQIAEAESFGPEISDTGPFPATRSGVRDE